LCCCSAWISEDQIWPYIEFRSKFMITQKVQQSFKEAVDAIEQQMQAGDAAVADLVRLWVVTDLFISYVATSYKINHWFPPAVTDVLISGVRLLADQRTKVLWRSYITICVRPSSHQWQWCRSILARPEHKQLEREWEGTQWSPDWTEQRCTPHLHPPPIPHSCRELECHCSTVHGVSRCGGLAPSRWEMMLRETSH